MIPTFEVEKLRTELVIVRGKDRHPEGLSRVWDEAIKLITGHSRPMFPDALHMAAFMVLTHLKCEEIVD